MEYFIHELDTDPPKREPATRSRVLGILGQTLFDALEESGSLSCGTTVYQARKDKTPPITGGLLANESLIKAAREWASDCQWRDLDGDQLDDLTPAELFAGIESNYDGGLAQFMRDQEPNEAPRPPEAVEVWCCARRTACGWQGTRAEVDFRVPPSRPGPKTGFRKDGHCPKCGHRQFYVKEPKP